MVKRKSQKPTFFYEKRKTLKTAKDLTYIDHFPEIKQKIKEATTLQELTQIMCTYRKKLINLEDNEKSKKQERKESIWIIRQ